MALRIYNTLTRQKEVFEPLHEGRVNMYVCGPTVYDYPHLGHAKSYIGFDVAVRYLRYSGYDTLYVQNITDVGHLQGDVDENAEDKVAARARARGVQPMQLVETFTREYFRAMDALNCLRPDISPRATGHIPEMIALIERLIENGHAYVVDGSVYFDVESFKEYGKLSNRRLEEQESGHRDVEGGSGKRHPADFALWKNAEGTGHLMRWKSPWSVGFPGWHIECSAMAMKYLGETLDIHGAGVENVFPHNEDEVAQSECATHQPFSRYWMHNGTVMVNGEKMSKSKGNFRVIMDEIGKYGAPLVRFWVLSKHYRTPVDYTDEGLQEAGRAMDRLKIALQSAERYLQLPEGTGDEEKAKGLDEHVATVVDRFKEAMDDDFNTPAALAVLFGLATEMNQLTASAAEKTPAGAAAAETARTAMLDLCGVLGLELAQAGGAAENDLTGPLVELVLAARQALRRNKDYAGADELRQSLGELGIVVEDRKDGSTWRRA